MFISQSYHVHTFFIVKHTMETGYILLGFTLAS